MMVVGAAQSSGDRGEGGVGGVGGLSQDGEGGVTVKGSEGAVEHIPDSEEEAASQDVVCIED